MSGSPDRSFGHILSKASLRGYCGGTVAEKQKPGRKELRRQGKSNNGGTAGFDSWLENKLRTAYSSVLDEPIPEDLIELISQKLKD
jgi:truncated hemoglobin YjbI